MPRYQATVTKGSRQWHSIRSDARAAIQRVSEHMCLSMTPDVYAAGKKLQSVLSYGAKEIGCAKAIANKGFTLTVKEI